MRVRTALALLPMVCAPVSLAAEESPPPLAARTSAGGSLAWVFSSDLDLLGSLRADVPFAAWSRGSVFLAVDTLTAIEKASSDFTFTVREVDYDLEVGARDTARSGARPFAALGQRGKELVDASGRSYVRYAAGGLESEGFRSAEWRAPWEWRASVGAILGRHDVDGNILARGEVRWLHRIGTIALGADARLEALVDRSHSPADLAAGPRLDVDLAGGRRVSFFARYLRERNPLGTGITGAAVGFDYREEGRPGPRPSPPDVGGAVATGAGGGRAAGELAVRVASPAFATRYRAVLDVDANVVTGADVDELYYLYHLGVEREANDRRIGAYAYHRSNHELGQDNPLGVTSVNVVEAGVESAAYTSPVPRGRVHRWGALDYRIRAGAVLRSSFDSGSRLHGRGGVRWALPHRSSRWVPFASVDGEAGNVGRLSVAVGIATPSGIDGRLEYRRDDQYFGRDKSALLLVAALPF